MPEIFKSESHVTDSRRARLNGQRGAVLWLTGLSGSGKSTIAQLAEELLLEGGIRAYVLDGDNLRFGLNADLGFSDADRAENIRRIGSVAALFAHSGTVTLVSAISPFRHDREKARRICESMGCAFAEIYIDTSLEECKRRDTKGLYKKALSGEISAFTGISSPYEAPDNPDIRIDTQRLTAQASAQLIYDYIGLLQRLGEITQHMCGCAVRAGEKILEIYNDAYDVSYKGDGSPLTTADLAANEIICASLRENYPQYAILSEESKDSPERMQNPLCFIVDPLDGTKEFVKRNGEFTVNIALCYMGKPVASAVYVPVSGVLYYAAKGMGAYSQTGTAELFDNDRRIRVSDRSEQLTVMTSRSHINEALERLLEKNKPKIGKIISAGSSLKGCMIAAGEADAYYRMGLTCEWDTAAMQCVIEQAGGILRQGDGSPMTYNRADTLNSKGFYILNRTENKFDD